MERLVFQRSIRNPIITEKDLPFRAAAVLNPGATVVDGEVILLLRIEDRSGHSDIHVARSEDGVGGWRIEAKPLLRHGLPPWRYERWGCEDARVTYVAERKWWYITYTAYSPAGAAVALARTRDFADVDRVGLIFSPNNKDAVLFPTRFGDRWAVLHRPDAGGIEHIWSAYSPDLIHWGEPHCVLPEGGGPAWDAVKVGAGPPPLLTDRGWLLIYHGVKAYGGNFVYRAGLALLERQRPHKVIARFPDFVFQAAEPYERNGLVPNVVFPSGLIQRGEEIWMYYGVGDSCVCLATAKLDELLALLETPASPGPRRCE